MNHRRSTRALPVLLLLPAVLFCPTAPGQPAPTMKTRWTDEARRGPAHPEYPRPQMVRDEWRSLNGPWEFAEAKEGEAPPIRRALPERILVPFPIESTLSGIGRRMERAWYRRTFDVPESWADRTLLLHFGAVDFGARVWVNGTLVGEHRGGYDAFTCDLTDALGEKGEHDEHELVVGVWDPTDAGPQARGKQVRDPRGIWYTPTTGIWQSVWLEPVSDTHIRSIALRPSVDDSSLRVGVDVAGMSRSHSIDVIVREPGAGDGRLVARAGGGARITVPIENPKLWSPSDPFLYDVEIVVRWWNDPARIVDRVRSYFGLRSVSHGPDEQGAPRLRLNGRPVFHIGTLDQGFWPDGLYTAPTDAALRYDIEITKKLGFNTIRKHVKIEPDRWYYWCDVLGVLVWQDMPSGDASVAAGKGEITRSPESAAQFEEELTHLVTGRGNHPCIVMWVPFNEGWGQYDTARIVDLLRRLDPSRLVNSASGWNDLEVGDVHDVHSYPGPAAPPVEPGRAAVLGEFGGLGLGIDGHTWSEEAWGYRGTADRDELTRRYEQLLRRVWELQKESGLAAAIYTQITDVETECNGLLTYDREITKVDVERVRNANTGRLPEIRAVVPTARQAPVEWRFTLEEPSPTWSEPTFEDSAWTTGPAGFGRKGTPGAIVRTEWTTNEIWLRRSFTLDGAPPKDLLWFVHHDEDVAIYLNGVLALERAGYTTTYEEIAMSAEARALFRAGRNTLAVRCRQTGGGQYIDVGFVRLVKR